MIRLFKVEKFGYLYFVLRQYFDFFHNWIFYERIYRTYQTEKPKHRGPALIAGNHQNALMDALVILCSNHLWQPVFISRADLFVKKPLRLFLYALKMIPVYRIRDGKENLSKNYETFRWTNKILLGKGIIPIFPEANHAGFRRLRPLKKGITRMAFAALQESDFKEDIKIFPVGINYDDYFSFRSSILINFGEPIHVKDYEEIFKQNEARANLLLVKELEKRMKPLMIHIESVEYYDNYELMRDVYDKQMLKRLGLKNTHVNKFKADKKTIEVLDNLQQNDEKRFKKLQEKITKYRKILADLNLKDKFIEKTDNIFFLIIKTLFLLITLPVYIFGAVNNAPMHYLPNIMTRKFKDRQFHTSVRFVFYFFLYPIYYLIIFLITKLFINDIKYRLLYIVLLPFTGIFAFYWVNMSKNIIKKWRVFFNRKKYKNIFDLRASILKEMDELSV